MSFDLLKYCVEFMFCLLIMKDFKSKGGRKRESIKL